MLWQAWGGCSHTSLACLPHGEPRPAHRRFLLGSTLNAAAQNLAMLIVGRICLGFGIGCANQSVPLYLSEMAPSKYRGGMNIM